MLIETIPYNSIPQLYFQCISHLPWAMWLDSGYPNATTGRYDIFVAAPYKTLVTQDTTTSIQNYTNGVLQKGITTITHSDVFAIIHNELMQTEFTNYNNSQLPFMGGAVGYWGYELAHPQLGINARIQADLALPDMAIGMYDWAIVVDHHQQHAQLISPHNNRAIENLILHLHTQLTTTANFSDESFPGCFTKAFQTEMTWDYYQYAFSKIQNYLRAGDCYQINLTQRFNAHYQGNLFQLYLALRQRHPVPMGAYLQFPFGSVLSFSPERLLMVDPPHAITQPIKGTCRRDHDPAQDRLLAEALQNSEKNRAENIMIVDLLRNDLSKTCRAGTVKVPDLCKIESFATVHHLVSTVTGEINHSIHAIDVLRGCFPGGSITGAPKKRAMEIIEEIELTQRNIYCGAIGYVSTHGNLDSNIAIRTLTALGNQLYVSVGGGIVVDSKVDEEYEECLNKIAFLSRFSQKNCR